MFYNIKIHKLNIGLLLASLIIIAGCTAPVTHGINDPHETRNREVHAANRKLDQAVVKPASGAYGGVIPAPVRQGVGNFAANLNLPGIVVNNLLQLDLDSAVRNASRFLFNTTIGLAGVLDPSSAMGLYEESSDFGETLHVWGMGEGDYIELPIVGPSTERDMLGMVGDLFTNPLTFGTSGASKLLSPVSRGLSKLGDRYTFSKTVDSILYDSADSYAQARLLYLQHRRFELGIEEGTDDDPYADPYEDPYAE